MDAEKVMDGIIDEIYSLTGELAANVKAEQYEIAAILKVDIEDMLHKIADNLIEKKLTTLQREQLDFYLAEVKHSFLIDWFEVMEMEPPEREHK
jgi:hypothetical protein